MEMCYGHAITVVIQETFRFLKLEQLRYIAPVLNVLFNNDIIDSDSPDIVFKSVNPVVGVSSLNIKKVISVFRIEAHSLRGLFDGRPDDPNGVLVTPGLPTLNPSLLVFNNKYSIIPNKTKIKY